MVLKVTNKGKKYSSQQDAEKEKAQEKVKKRKEKYEDIYHPEFPPTRILVKDIPKMDGDLVKQYLEFKVQRANDEYGLPHVYITGYQESKRYTGYQKGRTIVFPLEALYEVMDTLQELSDECDKRHIE